MGNTTDLSVRFKDYWDGFKPGEWQEGINTRDFIMTNFTPYSGGPEFLCGPTERTKALNAKLGELFKKERENGGVLDINTEVVSSLCNYPAAYLDKENELIVGYQTDAPLRRGVNPFGGIRMARGACEAYGYKLSQSVEEHFEYRTTHNDGVFRVYTDEMKLARHIGIITGLPDAYGRGRIIGDYRRVALYGVDYLIEQKQLDKKNVGENIMDVDTIRLSEELFQQISFLKKMKEMAAMYGYDISMPAELREVALCIKVNYITVFVTDRLYIGIFYSTERVSHYRQSRYTECHHSVNVCIVQSHLRLFVSVLVVHIVRP